MLDLGRTFLQSVDRSANTTEHVDGAAGVTWGERARGIGGGQRGLAALGLRVPEDVSVLAHDDHIARLQTAAFYPALSVTDAPLRDSWKPLAASLADLIGGEPQDRAQVVGPHRLILRHSTAAPRP